MVLSGAHGQADRMFTCPVSVCIPLQQYVLGSSSRQSIGCRNTYTAPCTAATLQAMQLYGNCYDSVFSDAPMIVLTSLHGRERRF